MLNSTAPMRLIHHIPPTPVVAGRGSPFTGRAVDARGFGAVRAVLLNSGSVGGNSGIDWSLCESDLPDGQFRQIDDGEILYSCTADVRGLSVLGMRIGPEAGRQRYLRVEVGVTGPGSLIFAVLVELYDPRQPGRFAVYDTAARGQNSPVGRRLN